jgi:hypothetical protein
MSLLMDVPAPHWLPWRWRNRWDQYRVDSAIRDLDRTPPMPAAAPAAAQADVQMLVCRRDLRMSVLALKSLMRFAPGQLAVTLTTDGSLSTADQAWADRHVPGCRWLPRHLPEQTLAPVLEGRPHLRALYGSPFQLVCKLVHAFAQPACDRVIVLDPDTAFLAAPRLLLDWVAGGDPHAYYMHGAPGKEDAVPGQVRDGFAEIAARAGAAPGQWRLDNHFFNSGLLLFRTAQCNLDQAEAYLRWRTERGEGIWDGERGIWFGEWTREQTAFLVMYALMDPPSRPLPEGYHLGPLREGGFNHFLREYMVHPDTLRRMGRLVAELGHRG